jgi:Helix-turn-helix domain
MPAIATSNSATAPLASSETDVSATLARLESRLAEVVALLLDQKTVKDWYSTADAAAVFGKAEFTVREWCRHGRIRAEKRRCGRGCSKEWMISRAELTRVRNEGLLPLEHRADG